MEVGTLWLCTLAGLCCALALAAPLAQAAQATPVQAGAALAPRVLADQHDRVVAVGAATRLIVFAAERPVGEWVQRLLAAQDPGLLERLHAVYLADISAMPAPIAHLFALPKLRELPFPVTLAREAATVADLPRHAGAATVLTLAGGKVVQVQYAQDAAQLRALLGLAP